MMVSATHGVIQMVDPAKWMEHRYGLAIDRWKRLNEKSFWITGAGTGYGRCLAVALASAGAQVFLTGRRREKLLESLDEMKSLGTATDKCHIVEADITNTEDVSRVCNIVKSLCVSLYGLINNAALPARSGASSPMQDESLEYFNEIIRTNVIAPWILTKQMFPFMKKSGEVRVLFITSEAGWAFTSAFDTL